MDSKINICLVAHDNKKNDLLQWASYNKNVLNECNIFATGTTGSMLETILLTTVKKYHSGPMGGDQEIGAAIVNKEIDVLIFFSDPLYSHPHDPDVKALLRIAVLYDIPMACNRKSADMIITSKLFCTDYLHNITQKI